MASNATDEGNLSVEIVSASFEHVWTSVSSPKDQKKLTVSESHCIGGRSATVEMLSRR